MSDLRERKKARTRDAIQREALRLIADQGYDATTCEQIAAAAEVSPATLFRYFATKEDIVLQDVYDPMIAAAVLARPADEPALIAVRRALAQALGAVYVHDLEAIRQRTALIMNTPALRSRSLEQQHSLVTHLAAALRERARSGRDRDDAGDIDIDIDIEADIDAEVEVMAAACAAALGVAVQRWASLGGDLPDHVDAAMIALGHLATEHSRVSR